MLNNLRWRIGFLLLGFVLLMSVSVASTAAISHTQTQAALAMNRAFHQQILVQQMTVMILQIERDDGQQPLEALRQAASTYEQTLDVLSNGGSVSYWPNQDETLSAASSPEIRAALEHERGTWEAVWPHLEIMTSHPQDTASFDEAIQSVEALLPQLGEHADEVVRLYEADSAQRITLLRWIQALFFAGALILLIVGVAMIHPAVFYPLQALLQASERIGRGDLSTSVHAVGAGEMRTLAQRLDDMRVQIRDAHLELETQVARHTRELTALHDVSQEITSHLKIDLVLDSVTGKARELLDSEVAFLCLLDETGQCMELRAYHGVDEAVATQGMPLQRSGLKPTLTTQPAILCAAGGSSGGCRFIAVPFRANHQSTSLRVGGQPIGALCVGRSEVDGFTADEARLLTKLGQSAAIAIENARLYESAERIATLEERQRIAADMHDGLAQTLSYLEMKIERLSEALCAGSLADLQADLAHIQAALCEANRDVRCTIARLQASSLAHKTVAERLSDLVGEFARQETAQIEYISPPQTFVALAPEHAEQVLRVAGEALQNARRHAGASHILVVLEQASGHLALRIEDNGCGFDPCVSPQEAGHFGLSIMRARAARLGGTLIVDSAPGSGTRVKLMWHALSEQRLEPGRRELDGLDSCSPGR